MNGVSKHIKCVETGCGYFEFTDGEQEFFAEKQYTEPKRCPAHRAARREQKRKEESPFHPKNWKK